MRLNEEQIAELKEWAESQRSRSGKSPAFNVLRGDGTGQYAAQDQLKIISIHGTPISTKQPTYHITLR